MDLKLKSRWMKNHLEGHENIDLASMSENNNNENNTNSNDTNTSTTNNSNIHQSNSTNGSHNNHHRNHNHNHHHHHHHHHHSSSKHTTPPVFESLIENIYLDKRKNDFRNKKEARSMVCDCILTKEERARGLMGCLDDCLNRMLMIECGPKCTLGDHCLNKRFQKNQSAKVEVFKTQKKGWGLRTTTELPANSFIMEYVGEVIRSKEFRSRVKKYTKQKIKHHYFMALRSDEIIDATCKGNLTRFINHSCEPNCETQKWTVNGQLRIGFFTIKDLQPGDEVTFDYQFQRYGRKAQKCYCEAPSCRGFIGGNEQTLSLNGHSSPQLNENDKSHKKAYKHGLLVDSNLEERINTLAENAAQGLKTKDQVIALATSSIKAEKLEDRKKLLQIIKQTKSDFSLRLFLDYHGLEIICLWMRDPQADCDFKANIIEILERLPIPNRTKVIESNVYSMVEKWATEEAKIVESPTKVVDPPQTPDNNVVANNNVNSPNIKALANRLLKKFQALAQGFKIPRLNRLQRKEIEKRMEEKDSDDIKQEKPSLELNNPFARSSKPPLTNGLVATSKTSTSSTLPLKRKFDASYTNNIDLTPAPKISKEEHRQQFEMHVRLKDWYETMKKHYGPAVVEQLKLNQRTFPSLNGLAMPFPPPLVPGQNIPYLGTPTHPLTPLIPPPLSQPPPLVVGQPPPTPQQQQQQQQPTTPILSSNITTVGTANNSTNAHLLAYPNLAVDSDALYGSQPLVMNSNLSTNVNSHYHTMPASLQSNDQDTMNNLAFQSRNGRDYCNHSFTEVYTNHVQASNKEAIESDIKTGSSSSSSLNIISSSMNNNNNKNISCIDVKNNPKPEPTNLPTLIVLANHSIEPSIAIKDDLAFSICDYDEYYTLRDRLPSAEDIKQNNDKTTTYPYPGSYYTTPDGETWFVTVTIDRKTQQPRTVILNLQQVRSDLRNKDVDDVR